LEEISPVVLEQRAASGRGPLQAGYCTRVGVYWSGVVRTARDPDLRGVHPNVGQ